MRRAPPLLQSLAALAGVIFVATSLAAGCGGNGSAGGKLTTEKAKANLEPAGYSVDKVTNGANQAIGPNGKLNADVYLSIDQDPHGRQLYVGAYFFSDPAARKAYATWARVEHVTRKKRDVQPVVEGEGVLTSAGESQDEFGQGGGSGPRRLSWMQATATRRGRARRGAQPPGTRGRFPLERTATA